MTKANITQYSATANSNTDIDDINIDENCPASGLNNALRSLMSHLKNVDTGSQALTALSVTGNVTVAGNIQKTSGDLTLDVAGDITLDADGAQIRLKDGGTQFGLFGNENSDFAIQSSIQDKDMLFQGNDGGVGVTALTLDMSDAGRAIFNAGLSIGGTGSANTLDDYEEGTWTPSLNQPSNRVGTWGSTLVGTYTKIGRKVTLHCSIKGSGMYFSSTNGYTGITGLPFQATQATNTVNYAGSWSGDSVSQSSGGSVYLHASTIYLHNSNGGTGVGGIGVSVTYFT